VTERAHGAREAERSNILGTISIRHASTSDVSFVSKAILDGARDGHFDISQTIDAVQATNEMIISQGMLAKATENGELLWVDAALWVAEKNHQLAAFMVCSREMPGSEKIEVLVLYTSQHFRRQGIARRLVRHAFQEYPNTLMAHCFGKSTFAMLVFEGLGFRLVAVTPERFTYELVR